MDQAPRYQASNYSEFQRHPPPCRFQLDPSNTYPRTQGQHGLVNGTPWQRPAYIDHGVFQIAQIDSLVKIIKEYQSYNLYREQLVCHEQAQNRYLTCLNQTLQKHRQEDAIRMRSVEKELRALKDKHQTYKEQDVNTVSTHPIN